MNSDGKVTITGDAEALGEVYEAIVEALVAVCPVRVSFEGEGRLARLEIASSDPREVPKVSMSREGARGEGAIQ